jgi:acyl carrier protein
MTREQIVAKCRDLVSEQLGYLPDEIKDESSFMDDLGSDSLDHIELCMVLEEEFELDVADDEFENVKTFADATNLILNKLTAVGKVEP